MSVSTFCCRFLLVACLTGSLSAQAQTAPTWQQAISLGTGSAARALAITTDAAGNVYLAGAFGGSVTFGSQTLTTNGQEDLFVAKWNSTTHSFAWAQSAGGSRSDVAVGIAVSGTSVYVTGSFAGAVSFGSITLPNNAATTFTSDVVVAKLTDAGSSATWTWAQQAGGAQEDYAAAIAVSGPNVYICGSSQRQATFGGISVTNPGTNAFVAKLVDAGPSASFSWVQATVGAVNASLDRASALAVSGSGVYVAGSIRGSASVGFGPITLTNASPASPDLYVAKLVDAGSTASFAWARGAGGTDYDEASALAVSGQQVYVTGYFRSPTIDFGPTRLTNADQSNFLMDLFVAKLTDTGSAPAFTWALRAGGPDNEQASGLAVSGSSVYVTGDFRSLTAGFGPTTLTNMATNGSPDVFAARLTDAGPTASFTWAQEAGSASADEGGALALRGGTVYVTGGVGAASRFGSMALTTTGNYGGFLASFSDPLLLAAATPARPAVLGLYPNPVSDQLHLPALPAGTPLQLLDALGRVVRTAVVSAGATVPVRGLLPGLYTLRATDARGQQLMGKVVVE